MRLAALPAAGRFLGKAGRLAAFAGITPASSIPSGASFASLLSFTKGRAINGTPGWLTFQLTNGKLLHVAQMPIRTEFCWNDLLTADLLTGNRQITVGGKRYKVRLMTGSVDALGRVAGGEWDEFMYAVGATRPATYKGPILANYTNAQLGLQLSEGASNYCQETSKANGENDAYCVTRAYSGISQFTFSTKSIANANAGWRPVLEEI